MDVSALCELLRQELSDLLILRDESLSRHTTFHIGGNASLMIFPQSVKELCVCLKLLSKQGIKPTVLGAGSNILAPDEGITTPIICLRERFSSVHLLDDTTVIAEAGASLAKLATFAKDCSLTGLEFAHGIPGTVGGGVYMNAGAYGGEICTVAQKVTVTDFAGNLKEILCDKDTFGYRTSLFEGKDMIIVSATFCLQKGDKEQISQTMRELMERRRASQPLDLPSAGSTFKRPVGGYAAALIDEAGLKGTTVGGASVSEKHAGFIVNKGAASAKDVRKLIELVQDTVEEKTGIRLQPEVRIW